MSNNAHDLCNRLLNALDSNYNVVDMQAVNEIISILENFNITKELLETTRLGKHVNNMRRKTEDATLARRAKELVKRWRDLVIPTHASPAHTGSNRSSAERQMRRLGGTPLTSPALSRVVSPAVASPKSSSRPAWGGYESDSQDVILVDDDGPPAPAPVAAHAHTAPGKHALTSEAGHDSKKAKRDKKPKKKRGHSRAGSGAEAVSGAVSPGGWAARNGLHPPAPAPTPVPPTAPAPPAATTNERRRNGCRKHALDPYSALVNKIPHPGAKKVKTTKELLEQIQSRGSKTCPSPGTGDQDDDVVLVEDGPLIKVDSPLRNGGSSRPVSPKVEREPSPPRSPILPLEDPREYAECTCGEEPEEGCPAAVRTQVAPYHVAALHHIYLPGINGTRAPTEAQQFAVRRAADAARPGLFASVVPLYRYSDYADDYCVKNTWRVPLCAHLPHRQFAPPPPDPPPPPSPPPLRPYPVDELPLSDTSAVVKSEPCDDPDSDSVAGGTPDYGRKIEAEMVSLPNLEPSERLKAPILTAEDARQFGGEVRPDVKPEVKFEQEQLEHRTVERTKEDDVDGRTLVELCRKTLEAVPYNYDQCACAPVVTLPAGAEAEAVVAETLETADRETRDELGRPPRPARFTEWHESARLGDLIALPYVVID